MQTPLLLLEQVLKPTGLRGRAVLRLGDLLVLKVQLEGLLVLEVLLLELVQLFCVDGFLELS